MLKGGCTFENFSSSSAFFFLWAGAGGVHPSRGWRDWDKAVYKHLGRWKVLENGESETVKPWEKFSTIKAGSSLSFVTLVSGQLCRILLKEIFTTDIRYFITGYVTIDDVAKTVHVKRTSGGDRGYPFLLSVDFNSSKTTGRYVIMTNKMSVSWSYSCMDAGEPISMTSSLVSNTNGQIWSLK